ncbi:carboxylating nicotinate-nucleotide diphosphorylase [Patescibacteria group bacterium]|nr:carboxylating nicotinate-nucleotide diphosphorylase [Patescibacteria group bacterium]MBU1672872.1 carboxylating nicotinate-nucleotide diphosphorylase [Patescibacteria group bacterium]MBU1963123.1 carboxylating nicotinate-nucleotide diphosphorylase [Patescibacteria group bacterium]
MEKNKKIEKIFIQKEKLSLKDKAYKKCVERYTVDVLDEDVGKKGDITSAHILKGVKKKKADAVIKAHEKGIVAGVEEMEWFLKQNKLKTKVFKRDGEKASKGDKILKISGKPKDILKTERVVLNVISRMSGIATECAKLRVYTKGKVVPCPTRKTLWSLMDKKACVVGGGGSHRLGLWNFILIKDNHLDLLNNDMKKALAPLQKSKRVVEVEVSDKGQALEAAGYNPDIIMFDNWKPKKIKKMINKIDREYKENEIIFEASGGITRDNIKKYVQAGVDVISLGYITHSAKSMDFSLDFI